MAKLTIDADSTFDDKGIRDAERSLDKLTDTVGGTGTKLDQVGRGLDKVGDSATKAGAKAEGSRGKWMAIGGLIGGLGGALLEGAGEALLQVGGAVFDATKKAAAGSDTYRAAQAKLTSSTSALMGKIGTGLAPALTKATQWAGNLFSGTGRIGAVMRTVGSFVSAVFTPTINVLRNAWTQLHTKILTAAGGQQKLDATMTKVGAVVVKVGGFLGTIFKIAVNNVVTAVSIAITVATTLHGWFGKIQTAGDKLRGGLGSLGDKIRNVPLGPFGTIGTTVDKLVGKVQSAISWFGTLGDKISGVLSAGGGFLDKVLGRDIGGGMAGATGSGRIPPPPPTSFNPTIAITIDGPTLRSIVRSEIRRTITPGSEPLP